MSDVRIRRKSLTLTATVGTSVADATAMDCNAMVGGIIAFDAELPTAATSLTFYASDTATGSYRQLFDKDGAAVSVTLTTTTGVAYALPYDVGGCGFLRVVSNAALGTASTACVAFKG